MFGALLGSRLRGRSSAFQTPLQALCLQLPLPSRPSSVLPTLGFSGVLAAGVSTPPPPAAPSAQPPAAPREQVLLCLFSQSSLDPCISAKPGPGEGDPCSALSPSVSVARVSMCPEGPSRHPRWAWMRALSVCQLGFWGNRMRSQLGKVLCKLSAASYAG